MKYLPAFILLGCAAKSPVVRWSTTATASSERIELRSSGDGSYTIVRNGRENKSEQLILTGTQIDELAELFRTQKACELAHDPSYTPAPDEGKTTLELAFPDQHCTVVLWNAEWQRGRAKEITETMNSMRPLRLQRPPRAP